MMLEVLSPDLCESSLQEPQQLVVEPFLSPSELGEVGRPLEVAARHPAGIGEDVGDDGDPAVAQDGVGLGGDRMVGTPRR